MWRLCREGWSLLAYFPIAPDPSRQPQGHGQVALVIPAFLTTDAVTRPLRDFLTRCGYRALGWELGINWGPTPRLLAALRARLSELNRLAGGPVSVIGVSLGGILARDLAHDRAGDIRPTHHRGEPLPSAHGEHARAVVRLGRPVIQHVARPGAVRDAASRPGNVDLHPR
jgi:hypothetical protein